MFLIFILFSITTQDHIGCRSQIDACSHGSRDGWVERNNQSQPSILTPTPITVIPSCCMGFTTVTTVTCVSQPVCCSVIWDHTARLPEYHTAVSYCTKYSSSRVSFHGETPRASSTRRRRQIFLPGDKGTVCLIPSTNITFLKRALMEGCILQRVVLFSMCLAKSKHLGSISKCLHPLWCQLEVPVNSICVVSDRRSNPAKQSLIFKECCIVSPLFFHSS